MFEQEGTEETEVGKCAVSRELRVVVARKCAVAVGRLSAPLRRAGTASRVVASRVTGKRLVLVYIRFSFLADGCELTSDGFQKKK